MTWDREIDHAMKRGNSPYTSGDLIRWMGEGRAELWIGWDMHASGACVNDQVEVGHLCGKWNDDDVAFFMARMQQFAEKHGRSAYAIRGRKGWQRFLEQKGIEL